MKTCKKCNLSLSVTEFYVNNANKDKLSSYCKDCTKLKSKNWSSLNKERKKMRDAEYYLNNKDSHNLKCKIWREKNKEKNSLLKKKWAEQNRDKRIYSNKKYRLNNKENYNNSIKKWRKNNPHILRAKDAKRKSLKLRASLGEFYNSVKLEILTVYKNCSNITKSTGIKHHVDHIIPLKNKKVCGLHVPWNLQILTGSQNCKKLNKFDGTYDNESWKSDIGE